MKKKVMNAFIVLFLILSISLIYADDKAGYACLESKTNDTTKCSNLQFEARVFTLLANGNCQDNVSLDNTTNPTYTCFPKDACTIKSTAQAVLALEDKLDTQKAEDWLFSQKGEPSGMEWFLEIESPEATRCLINISSKPGEFLSYQIIIGEDKRILANSMKYMRVEKDNPYWLKIESEIYNKPINITCNKPFITTLLFKKKDSSAIHVSSLIHESFQANGKTQEEINSICFGQGTSCDYEGGLWAALVLNKLGYKSEIAKYLPYLITGMDDSSNEKYLSEAFLYHITGEFETDLLNKQTLGYWEVSNYGKYYDTALALWPLYYQNVNEKTYAKAFLLDKQLPGGPYAGCWDSNVRDTAFILYSVWPESPPVFCLEDNDCPAEDCEYPLCIEGDCFTTPSTEEGCVIELECEEDEDCEDLNFETDTFCSKDKKKVLKNVSTWTCGSENKCVEKLETKSTDNCLAKEQCYSGECASECTLDEDCDGSKICLDDYCITPECDEDSDCGSGTCVDWKCVEKKCTTSDDCEDYEVCNAAGVCVLLGCESEGYYCMSSAECDDLGGNTLEEYSCSSIYSCCDEAPFIGECSNDYSGEICSFDEYCSDEGVIFEASDTSYDEICCVGGICIESEENWACEDNGGDCRTSCNNDEEEDSDYTCDFDEECCFPAEKDKPKYILIWILLILILLSTVGIVFREKLKILFLKLKDKFGKKKERKPFGMPSTSPLLPPNPRLAPRRMLPPSQSQQQPVRKPFSPMQRPQLPRKPEEKSKNELDDVLKKLKEIGK